jgi:hypothetical protein
MANKGAKISAISRVNVELKANVSEVSFVTIIKQMFCILNRFQIQFAWNIMQQATKRNLPYHRPTTQVLLCRNFNHIKS